MNTYLWILAASVFCSTVALSTSGAEPDERIECSKLRQILSTLEIDDTNLPFQHEAGQTYNGKIRLSKHFSVSPNDWLLRFSRAAIQLTTKHPYPTNLNMGSDSDVLAFLFGDKTELPISFSQNIKPNVGGEFDLGLLFLFFGRTAGYCVVEVPFGLKINIHSNDVHLTPPLVRSLQLDKASYKPGEHAISTFSLSSPLQKLETDHFEWVNPELERSDESSGFPEFKHNLIHRMDQNEDGTYTISFEIPQSAKPGKYYLKYFNRQDVFGNFESEVGRIDAEELNVGDRTPLIIGFHVCKNPTPTHDEL